MNTLDQRLQVPIDSATKERLRRIAMRERRSMANLVRKLILDHIELNGKEHEYRTIKDT